MSVTVAGYSSSPLFELMAQGIAADPSLAQKVKGVIQIDLTKDGKTQSWAIDMKSATPSIKAEKAPKADVTLTLSDADFVQMAEGKLNAQQAFMKNKLKIKGNMALAQKLEVVTKAAKGGVAAKKAGSVTVDGFKSSPLMQAIADGIAADGPELVKKVKGVIAFELTNAEGKVAHWAIDLKNGNGAVTNTKPAKADVTLVMKDADFVSMSEGKLNAQSAFMKGQLKIKGNMMLAQKLEVITKAAKAKL